MATPLLPGRKPHYTPEVKLMVVNMLRRYIIQRNSRRRLQRQGPQGLIAHIADIDPETLSSWDSQIEADGEPPAETRGGDRRSLEITDPLSSRELINLVADYIDERHNHRMGVVLDGVWQFIKLQTKFGHLITSLSQLARWMHDKGFDWERINKYEGLKESDYVQLCKIRFLKEILANE